MTTESKSRMVKVVIWVVFLLNTIPLAQTHLDCSNCVGGKCTTDGECLEGCVPGFVDIYCVEQCPPNCISNTCYLDRTRGTYVCSDGCQEGYCSSGCKLSCPNNCTTCDRATCSVCDVKPCQGNRYGKKCSPCPPNVEKCDKDTGQCIKCKKGFYGESCDKKCPDCLSIDEERQEKCQTGCDVCNSEPCSNSTYGIDCNMVCPPNCDKNRCNKSSGLCTEGCKSGFYGHKCDMNCNKACVKATCAQQSGACVYGCMDGFEPTNNGCYTIAEAADTTGIWPVIAVAVVSSILLAMSMVTIVLMLRNRRKLTTLVERLNVRDDKKPLLTKNKDDPTG